MATFGIGPMELIVLLVLGTCFIGIPIAVVAVLIFALRRNESNPGRSAGNDLREENARLRRENEALRRQGDGNRDDRR